MLSEDENKAIDILSKKEKIKLQSVLRIFKREGIENFVITRKEYLDTVLNLIEKLKKENEVFKRAFDRQSKDIGNYLLELQQKDKQIDLMTERIEWLCKSNGILLDIEHGENFNQKDIKQYFEKQAKEKGGIE